MATAGLEVATAAAFLSVFMAIGAEHGINHHLDQLQQAVVSQLKDQIPGRAAIK